MTATLPQAFARNFLGNAPTWYKLAIVVFLIINPILLNTVGPFITGWVLTERRGPAPTLLGAAAACLLATCTPDDEMLLDAALGSGTMAGR